MTNGTDVPEKKGDGCGKAIGIGCVVVLLLLAVAGVLAVKFKDRILRSLAAKATLVGGEGILGQTQLPEAEREAAMVPIRELADKIKRGEVNAEQAGMIAQALAEGPLLMLMMARAAEMKYLLPSELPPDEKKAGSVTLSQVCARADRKEGPERKDQCRSREDQRQEYRCRRERDNSVEAESDRPGVARLAESDEGHGGRGGDREQAVRGGYTGRDPEGYRRGAEEGGYGIRMPAMVAVMKPASAPPSIALNPSFAKSFLRSGTSAPMPPIVIATDPKFAKLQSAYVAMVNERSEIDSFRATRSR